MLERLVLLEDLLFESLSNTLLLLALIDDVEAALVSLDCDNLSMMEFLRATGFLRSFSE